MDLLSLGLTEWALLGLLLILALYKVGTWNYGHFASKGIKYDEPLPFLGSMACLTFRTKSFAYFLDDIYKKFINERLVGIFQFLDPILMVKDPDLIKQITVKDFEHFTDHAQTLTENADPLFGKNLFSLRGERWRDMRNTLSPAFTSSKMKAMFNFMNECGQQLADYLQNETNKQGPGRPYVLEMKDLFTKFTNDVIATSAFGIHIDSLKEKDNYFYRMGKQVTDFSSVKSFIFLGYMLAPKLMKMLRIKFLTKEESGFFTDLVHQTITAREKDGIIRPDMIHLLMQARRGELKTEAGEEEGPMNGVVKAKTINLTEDDIAAQAMIFFFAGFDTASTLLSFTAILTAIHDDVQKKLQDELDEILGADLKVTYDKVQKMKYLDMVLSEALRLYPPTLLMDRQCTKNYTIPSTDKQPSYTIREGDQIWIPTYSIQRDPEFFPDPDRFEPERFSDENKQHIKPYTYLPFGIGPRLCIGQRFVLLEAKVAMIHILSRFDLTVVDKTPLPLKLTAKGIVMVIEGGFWIGAKPRQKISI